MKKQIIPLILVIGLLLCGLGNSAIAVNAPNQDAPNASLYLSSYAVDLVSIGNGQMSVGMDINATGTMSKLGVFSLYIEQKIDGVWTEFDTVYGMLHSDFYMYNTNAYLGEYIFNGVAGRQYRVTMTAYARNSSGSDTGTAYSNTATCCNP